MTKEAKKCRMNNAANKPCGGRHYRFDLCYRHFDIEVNAGRLNGETGEIIGALPAVATDPEGKTAALDPEWSPEDEEEYAQLRDDELREATAKREAEILERQPTMTVSDEDLEGLPYDTGDGTIVTAPEDGPQIGRADTTDPDPDETKPAADETEPPADATKEGPSAVDFVYEETEEHESVLAMGPFHPATAEQILDACDQVEQATGSRPDTIELHAGVSFRLDNLWSQEDMLEYLTGKLRGLASMPEEDRQAIETISDIPFPDPEAEDPAEADDPNPDPPITAKPIYDFSHGRRCPWCNSPNTARTGGRGRTQYRKCCQVVPPCPGQPGNGGRNYTVYGKEV